MNFFDENKIKYIIEGIKFLFLISIISLLVYLIINYPKSQQKTEETTKEETLAVITDEEIKQTKNKNLTVDIKGAIKTPGVYTLEEGSIVNDLIKLSGGVNKGVSLKSINLSKKLEDEMVVYIYTDKELKELETKEVSECNCPTIDISKCEGSSIITSNDQNSSSSKNGNFESSITAKININTATISELMTLSGIGESKAQAILTYRSENGSFKNIEEIKNVPGIGESIYQKIKDNITI